MHAFVVLKNCSAQVYIATVLPNLVAQYIIDMKLCLDQHLEDSHAWMCCYSIPAIDHTFIEEFETEFTGEPITFQQ